MPGFYNNAIFWIEVDKIKPNPFQPRKEFDEAKLNDLAKSIRQYGVLQPLTVSRREVQKEDGGIAAEYELIAGERRLRASKIAGIAQVPVLIREAYDDDKTKLELAIIENLQREDLNSIDRAKAFDKLAKEFNFKHVEIAEKIGKSREYVSNTIRLLGMPQEMQDALRDGKISEGHTRPILMLADRPQEQQTLFREILLKRLTVRDTENIARRIAVDRVRKKEYLFSPEVIEMERELSDALGTRVAIEPKEHGGKLSIDYTSEDDLRAIFIALQKRIIEAKEPVLANLSSTPITGEESKIGAGEIPPPDTTPAEALDDRSKDEKERDENTFDPTNFSI
ncbi:ParB/RepB/Spo0J family partition protein [Acetobacteraceae bacterium]|nr:ParB/RepB/Spo0J family partition protein [Candidatus Parcubacteria bacterium]